MCVWYRKRERRKKKVVALQVQHGVPLFLPVSQTHTHKLRFDLLFGGKKPTEKNPKDRGATKFGYLFSLSLSLSVYLSLSLSLFISLSLSFSPSLRIIFFLFLPPFLLGNKCIQNFSPLHLTFLSLSFSLSCSVSLSLSL